MFLAGKQIRNMELNVAGLASGFDWKSMVDKLADIERSPQTRLRTEQTNFNSKNSLLSTLAGQLASLETAAEALSKSDLFDSRSVNSSEPHTTATASAGTATGDYRFEFYQMATPSKIYGGSDTGSDVVVGNVLTAAGFGSAISAGTVTVQGKQVTIDLTKTLTQTLADIQTAVGGTFTATLTNDLVTFNTGDSSTPLVMGSSTDTSNLLTTLHVTNNGTQLATSTHKLGGISLSDKVDVAKFRDGVVTAPGSFKLNNITISYTAADSIADLMGRINTSEAGVMAMYDSISDRFVLSNKTDGDFGIAMEDVTGNFLAKSKMLTANGGSLTRGKNLIYCVNEGAITVNQGKTITEAGTGITGLTIKPTKAAGAALRTSVDTAAEAITTAEAHKFKTGEAIKIFSPGTIVGGLSDSTTYFARVTGSNSFTLHTTEADANSSTNLVNLTSAGSGDVFFLGAGPVSATVSIAADTGKIRSAISGFVDQYNRVQTAIAAQTKVTTNSAGKVTRGPLSDERLVIEIASSLRAKVNADVSGMTGVLKRLESIGYSGNGYDNNLTLSNSSSLDIALRDSIGQVKALFTTETHGFGNFVDDYLETIVGQSQDDGALVDRRNNLTKLASDIDGQIEALERRVMDNRQRMIKSFVSMETAQAKVSQQMQFLNQRFNSEK